MADDKKKMTAQVSSVGADDGQSISQNYKTTIPDPDEKSNSSERDLEELYRKMRRMNDPAYLHSHMHCLLHLQTIKIQCPNLTYVDRTTKIHASVLLQIDIKQFY